VRPHIAPCGGEARSGSAGQTRRLALGQGTYPRVESVFANFGLTDFNAGPFASQGGILSVNVASPSSPLATKPLDLHLSSGPSLRTLIEKELLAVGLCLKEYAL